jgi:hypothetical protein
MAAAVTASMARLNKGLIRYPSHDWSACPLTGALCPTRVCNRIGWLLARGLLADLADAANSGKIDGEPRRYCSAAEPPRIFHNGAYPTLTEPADRRRNTRYRKPPYLHLCFQVFTAESANSRAGSGNRTAFREHAQAGLAAAQRLGRTGGSAETDGRRHPASQECGFFACQLRFR